MNFTPLRLSSSPAASPNIIDGPSSPTKSVYLDMDETTPTSPQMWTNPYSITVNASSKTTGKRAVATNGSATAPAIRRTNFFDSDSSSDDDHNNNDDDDDDENDGDEDEDELTTADDVAFSQRHSSVASPPSLLSEDIDRGRSLTRSPLLLAAAAHSPSTPATTTNTKINGDGEHDDDNHNRKGAYYLGVRPDEYVFVCGMRPTSSAEASSYHFEQQQQQQQQGRGYDGYTRYDVPASSSPPLPPPPSSSAGQQQQRQTLRAEGVSPKHVPFGAPDLAVAARRVLADRDQRRRRRRRDKEGLVPGAAATFFRGRESSSPLAPSASEYDDGSVDALQAGFGRERGRNGGDEMLKKGTPLSYGDGEISPGNSNGGKSTPATTAVRSDSLEEDEAANDGAAAETQSKTDNNILGVHAITLQALLRDEEGLQASASSVRRKSASSEFSRREILKLQGKLSQHPQGSATPLPPPVPEIPPMSQIQQSKRVAVVPPSIDIRRSRGTRSESKVKTPYPFHHHKNIPKTLGSPGFPPPRARDAVLTLSIRRRRDVLSSRVARVTLPAELLGGNYYAANGFGDDVAPEERPPPVFDDAAFFKDLRIEYARLAGRWWRFFSARSLRRITVGHTTAWFATESCPGPAACGEGRCCPAARAAHGSIALQQRAGCSAATPSGIYHVRSPRFLASQGLKDTFSEENLLAHFRKPRMGRRRFAWVLWASRLAGLHEQPDLSTWRAQQQHPQGQHQKRAECRDRELPPTPDGGSGAVAAAAGKWVDASGRTASTASTAFAAGGSDGGSKEDEFVVSAAELGLAGGIGPRHSIATLEFVEGWSIARILVAVLLVLLLAAAGIVLWILFGSGVLVEGFRGSGARVGTAVLIGAGVLLFGWTLVLVWMGISWCVV